VRFPATGNDDLVSPLVQGLGETAPDPRTTTRDEYRIPRESHFSLLLQIIRLPDGFRFISREQVAKKMTAPLARWILNNFCDPMQPP
jgi:hypothetical protein